MGDIYDGTVTTAQTMNTHTVVPVHIHVSIGNDRSFEGISDYNSGTGTGMYCKLQDAESIF
jgi:hypothetical protein